MTGVQGHVILFPDIHTVAVAIHVFIYEYPGSIYVTS